MAQIQIDLGWERGDGRAERTGRRSWERIWTRRARRHGVSRAQGEGALAAAADGWARPGGEGGLRVSPVGFR